jgi:photosystem II stability/assembly factor-like uncharacterized protein
VDSQGEPPYIASLDVNPADGALYLATNRGLYVVPEGARRPRRLTGRLTTRLGAAEVSRALAVRFTGPDRLVGSGHPNTEGSLPPLLGLIASEDGGRTWESVAELGDNDFHDLQLVRGRLVLGVAGEAQALVSTDEGRTFETRALPLPLVDLEVDPQDPRRWVATTEQGLFTSADDGRTWRARDAVAYVRVAWAPGGTLYRADPEGGVLASRDGGASWEARGAVGELPQALTAEGPQELHAALLDGSVRSSTDGGRTWRVRLPAQ